MSVTSPSRARRRPFRTCCALLALLALPAHAQTGWYVAPEVSYFYPDPAAFDDSDISLGISVGRVMADGLRLELGYHALELVPEGTPGLVKQYSAHIAGQFDKRLSPRWSTYAGVGLGATRAELGGDSWTLPYAIAGAGLSWAITPGGDLRLDQELRARYSRDADEMLGREDLVDGQFLVRVRYHFAGAESAPAPDDSPPPAVERNGERETSPVDRDSDGDGVPDSRDRCPNTIPGVRVDADGCMVSR